MKKSVVLSTLAAVTVLASGQALAHPSNPHHHAPVNPTPGTHVVLEDFNCELGDVLDGDGHPVAPKPYSSQMFHTGFHIGQDLVNNAWMSSHMDVTALDQFVVQSLLTTTAVMNAGLGGLELVQADEGMACRMIGVIQGATYGVASVIEEVISSCSSDGDYWSTFAAGLFCEFSQIAQGLTIKGYTNHEPSVCALAFETVCEARFEDNARDYTSPTVNDCNQWVDHDELVFKEQRHNLCILNETHHP